MQSTIENRKPELRIGSIAVEPMFDGKYAYNIFHYYPNPYYKREGDFIKSKTMPGFYEDTRYEHWYIHEDVFKSEESKYTLAFITDEEEPNVISVGTKAWQLSVEDTFNFKALLNYIFNENGEDEEN